MAKHSISAKKDFDRIRKDMRKQLTDATKIKFGSNPARKARKTAVGIRRDFAKIRKDMRKTEKQLERGRTARLKIRAAPKVKTKKAAGMRRKFRAGAEKVVLKVSRKEIEDVMKIQKVKAPTVSRKYTITKAEIKYVQQKTNDVRREIGKIVVGQEQTITDLLIALLCDGHVLIEGVPGIAKTLIIRALASATGGSSQRIQFTADLLPTDIVGLTAYEKSAGFHVIKGPIFANFVLADEINRASPKVQAAMLEAMQEREVTIFKNTYALPKPFFVMATQNPLESLGVYPLPQAQIDRFLFKVLMQYPTVDDEQKVLVQNITTSDFESYNIKPAATPAEILRMQEIVKKVHLSERMERYIINIINSTRNAGNEGLGRFVQWGTSPRGSIGLYIASKAAAVMDGSDYVRPHHIKSVLHQVLRHRIILTYEGQAEDINADDVIEQIVSKVRVP